MEYVIPIRQETMSEYVTPFIPNELIKGMQKMSVEASDATLEISIDLETRIATNRLLRNESVAIASEDSTIGYIRYV